MAITATGNFVKFIRGTSSAFENLKVKDAHTLYFICDADETTGKLYLGDKLIGGGSGDLGSVIINEIGDKQLLQYNVETKAWENVSIEDAIGVMVGATEDTDGEIGLVPAPTKDDINKFLRGDGVWATPTVTATLSNEIVDESIFSVDENGKLTLPGFKEAAEGSIPQKAADGTLTWTTTDNILSDVSGRLEALETAFDGIEGGLSRTIVDKLEDIDPEAEDADKHIYLVPNGADANSGNMYDEYMVIDGKVEKVGTLLSNTNLTDYITATQLATELEKYVLKPEDENDYYITFSKYNSEVGDLSQLIVSEEGIETLVDQVNFLTDKLTWQELNND